MDQAAATTRTKALKKEKKKRPSLRGPVVLPMLDYMDLFVQQLDIRKTVLATFSVDGHKKRNQKITIFFSASCISKAFCPPWPRTRSCTKGLIWRRRFRLLLSSGLQDPALHSLGRFSSSTLSRLLLLSIAHSFDEQPFCIKKQPSASNTA